MSRFKRAVLWAALLAIILLALMSVYGAFLGAEQAQAFFNSLPLVCYWFALAVLLVAGSVLFRRLVRVPSLLLMHTGCVLALVGGMWGSQAGHTLARAVFGIDRITKGQMGIFEQSQENQVRIEDGNNIRELPFHVRVKDFRMEYYEPGTLFVRSRSRQTWKLLAAPGSELALDDLGTLTIRKTYANFKVDVKEDGTSFHDAPGGSNPALEVVVEKPDGASVTGYVFERFAPMFPVRLDFDMSYRRTVRDYVSTLEIVKDGRVVAAKDIEVNHPLHYGGYHFYQHSYGEDQGREYTVLMVVSDAGLSVVYGGYLMLIGGTVWHFWGRRIVAWLRTRQMMAPAENAVPKEHR